MTTKLPALILSITLAGIGGSADDRIIDKGMTAAAGGGSGPDRTTRLSSSDSDGSLVVGPALSAPSADMGTENRGTNAIASHGGMTPGCDAMAEVGNSRGKARPAVKRVAEAV